MMDALYKYLSAFKQWCVCKMQLFKQFSEKLESSWASSSINRNLLIPAW